MLLYLFYTDDVLICHLAQHTIWHAAFDADTMIRDKCTISLNAKSRY